MNQPSDAAIRISAFDALSNQMASQLVQSSSLQGFLDSSKGRATWDVAQYGLGAGVAEQVCKEHLLGSLAIIDAPWNSNLDIARAAASPLTTLNAQITSPFGRAIEEMNSQHREMISRLVEPARKATMGAVAGYLSGFAGAQSAAAKMLESYQKPLVDMSKFAALSFDIKDMIEHHITAADILGRNNVQVWSEPLRQAVEHMNTALWNEEEVLARLKGVGDSLGAAGVVLDVDDPEPDIDTLVEENFEVVERVAEHLNTDEELRYRAAEIFVGPAIKQLTMKEKTAVFVATATYIYGSVEIFSHMDNAAWSLLGFVLASLTYYFGLDTVDETMEKRREEKVQEIVSQGEA